MRKMIIFTLVVAVLLVAGCTSNSRGIAGIVVDAESGKPIEGAVVMAEWTRATGIGDKHTKSVKVVEKVTDKDGRFSILGTLKPFVDLPDLTIYKKGYVAWSSRILFPDHRQRTDFQWGGDQTIRLERFKPEYSYVEHTSFIDIAIRATIGKKRITEEAYRWEELEASKERDRKR
ncbi:MAG: carboxypeptidase-like regulatory domain-containing protein [Thermodesulfovibrionales bacterium]